ncbi:MAG: hypothetical protein J6B81_00935 [Spirochaetaceae bacterium]|nr:hypothetical protein [Spirochaetaceae bacterium]
MKITKKRQRNKLARLASGVCFFLITTNVYANKNLSNQEIDSSVFQKLVNNGRIDRVVYKEPNLEPELCPDSALGDFVRDVWTSSDEPVFIAESLFYLPKEDGVVENEIPFISKIMRSISTMEGISYFSNSSGKIETLYNRAYTIDNPDDMNKIPDKIDVPADNLSLYVYQEDNSFGDTVYKADIRQTENEVAMVLRSVEPIKFGFINAVKRNNLTMSFLFMDKGEYIITYIYAQLKFPALSIFESKVNESFRARIDAIYNWFVDSYMYHTQTNEKE